MGTGRVTRHIAGMSGAQAAAGDLLRARAQDQVIEEEEVDEALLESATSVFTAFETYFKARRTYGDAHPAVDRLFGVLDEKLRASLSIYDELELMVTARGLELAGRAVYAAERPDHNMWFPLYRDGIRELGLSAGVDRDEISRLCAALVHLASIKPGEQDDDGEDDAVTMLWDLALENISYVAIDTFVDGAAADEETRKRVEKIREIVTLGMMKELAVPPSESIGRDLEAARRLKSVALTKTDLTALRHENLAALDEVPERGGDERQDGMYALDANECAALARAIPSDPVVVEKAIDAVVHALLADGRRDHAAVLCARIERAFTSLVVSGRFPGATQLRKRVLAAAGAKPDAELFGQIDRAMSADAAVTAIAKALAERAEDAVGEVIALAEVLPARAAQGLIAGLAAVQERRRRRWVCDVIAPWGAAAVDAVSATITNSSEELALDLLYLLKKVGTDAAVAGLDRASRHTSPAIRAGAVRFHGEIAPLSTILVRARNALRDDDTLVRAAGLDILVARRPDGAVRLVKEQVDGEKFGGLELAEKKRLFVAYAQLGGDEVAAELITRLEQRNLLARASIDDERAAAASALGALRHAGARAALERLAQAKLVRGVVKTACVDALAELDRGPVPATPSGSQPLPIAPPAPPPAEALELVEAPIDAPPVPSVTFRPTRNLGAPLAAAPAPTPPAPTPPTPPATAPARPAGPVTKPITPVARPPASRTDSRSASGVRSLDEGVAIPKRDSRSASGVRPQDEGVAIPKPRVRTQPLPAPTPPKGPKRDG